MAPTNAYVLGVGMTKFLKPRHERTYHDLGFEAGVKALLDAHITFDDVEMGVGTYTHSDSCSGQRVFYQLGMTGIPIYNTNNACATGSTGLYLAQTMIRNGAMDCAMVIGFDTMEPGSIKTPYPHKPSPQGLSYGLMEKLHGKDKSPSGIKVFAEAGKEYMEKYGAEARDFAEIGRINHKHAVLNPYSQFSDIYTVEQIEQSPLISWPLTKLQCSPTSDGAAAAVLVSQRFLDQRPDLKNHAILIAGQAFQTDGPDLYSTSMIDVVGSKTSQRAAEAAFAQAKVSATDVRVCELHDCFATNELLLIEALGFCEKGKAHLAVRNGDITYGGKGPVINPSGGLIGKGHPIGATGLAQCAELVWQLRGWANNGRLVNNTAVALQHNLGLGGAVVVTVYKRSDGKKNTDIHLTTDEIGRLSQLGYNPAVEVRAVTLADAEKVRSKKCSSDLALQDTKERMQARL